jgi:glycosyltransferase involved in cell wall biosynthesis
MRILYLFPEPLPLPRARGIQVVNTVAALAKTGLHMQLAYVPVREERDPFVAYGLAPAHSVERVPLTRSLPTPFTWLPLRSNRLFYYRLRRWIKQQAKHGKRPQIIMVRHLKVAQALLNEFPDIPLLYEAHEVFADVAPLHKQQKLAGIEQTVLRRATALVAITRGAADDLKRRYRLDREIHVVHDAASLPDHVPEKPWHEAGRHVIYAGSFFAWKGVQDLIAAAGGLPGCRITLIGGSPEQIAKFRATVPNGGAEVVFAGHTSHAKAVQALGKACIAVLPNRQEPNSLWSSPLKLFEYMASGCAVVAADLPSLHEVLGENEAAWFRPGDPESLAAGIRSLAGDPEKARQLGKLMRERAQLYTWDERAKRLAEIMRSMV